MFCLFSLSQYLGVVGMVGGGSFFRATEFVWSEASLAWAGRRYPHWRVVLCRGRFGETGKLCMELRLFVYLRCSLYESWGVAGEGCRDTSVTGGGGSALLVARQTASVLPTYLFLPDTKCTVTQVVYSMHA
jgi:hypothetical protein